MPSVLKVGGGVKSVSKFLIVMIAVGCFAISGRAQDSQQPVTLDDAINGYQSVTNGHAGVPEDWSSHHLIFSQPVPGSATYDKVMQDPHYWAQQIRRTSGTKTLTDGDAEYYDALGSSADVSSLPDKKKKKTKKAKKSKKPVDGLSKDWTYNVVANGQVQPNMYPAKFAFFPATASCANDFVVFPTGVPGSGTAANIVGNSNLYTGGCSGTVPSLNWAYNTQGGMVTTSPIISYDSTGSQVAFIQVTGTTASLVLMKWAPNQATITNATGNVTSSSLTISNTTHISAANVGMQITDTSRACIPANDTIAAFSGTTVTLATATLGTCGTHTGDSLTVTTEALATPAAPPLFSNSLYPTCTAPCMTLVTLPANDTFSAPFYDIAHDAIYVGDDGGKLHLITPVFNGVPALNPALSNFPVTLNTGFKTTSPVYDGVSGYVFVGNTDAILYAVGTGNSGTTSGSIHGTSADLGDVIIDGPIVDSSAGTVYVFVSRNSANNNAVFQFSTGFSGTGSTGNGATAGTAIGSGNTTTGYYLYDGTFDNVYYSSSDPPSGSLWVMGNTGAAGGNLYRIPISMNTVGTPVTAISGLTDTTATHFAWASPATEFCNNGTSPCTSNGTITTAGTDYLFFSVDRLNNQILPCTAASGSGCILSYSLATAAATGKTNSSTSVTLTTGITTADIGAGISGTGIPAGDYITNFAGTTATLAAAATSTSASAEALTLGPILSGNALVPTVSSPGCWSTGGIIVDNAVPPGTNPGQLNGASEIYTLELNGNGAGGPTHGTYTSGGLCTTEIDTNTPIALQGAQAAP